MTGTAIVTRNLVKRRGRHHALDGFTLIVPRGSIMGLVGANGAGKTTWMMTVAGFLHPDAGEIDVLGGGPLRRFMPAAFRFCRRIRRCLWKVLRARRSTGLGVCRVCPQTRHGEAQRRPSRPSILPTARHRLFGRFRTACASA